MAKSSRITDAEMLVLKQLWREGKRTVREIAEELYGRCAESDIGAVHSLLLRLEGKRLVKRDRSDRVHVFSAAATRSEVAGQELQSLAAKVADGSLVPFLTHLVQRKKLKKEELEELRRLLDKHRC